MKYKIKEIDCSGFSFNKTNIEHGTLFNLKYNDDSLEFQTPKVVIDNLIKENNHEYIVLKILPTKACKTFFSKIIKNNINIKKPKEQNVKRDVLF
jgi:hypothetical protein